MAQHMATEIPSEQEGGPHCRESAESGGQRAWLISLLPAALGLAAGWALSGPESGFLYATLTFFAFLAILDQTAGLLILLSAACFDQVINLQLRQQTTWYPLALHVVDPIAAGLLLSIFGS